MNATQWWVAFGLAASMSAGLAPVAWAGDGSSEMTRADVKAAVLQARANGELRAAGEATEPMVRALPGPARMREEVRAEVREARANGQLIAAGEGVTPYQAPGASTLARADVKNEVLLARMNGELIPAGEGFAPMAHAGKPYRFDSLIAAIRGR